MMGLRPIPRKLLRASMEVAVPDAEGGYEEPVAVAPVRFEQTHEVVSDTHRADAVTGKVYVDAVMSEGAFEIPAGSRVTIDGASLLVASVRRFEGPHDHVHHWELEVR